MNEDRRQMPDSGEQPASAQQPAAPQVESRPKGTRSSRLRGLGVAALAILLYLVLVDAALDTFLSGSPVRWSIGGSVAGYIGLSVLLWRRLGWAAKAEISLFVAFGLLAITAWLPQGLSHGMTVLRQPTSTVLAVVTTLVMLFAGLRLVRLRFIPLAGKCAIGFLAAYGLAAFAMGIATGIAYPDLFRGRNVWERLPFWLQGSVIGALVLVPAALLIHIGHGLLRVRGTQIRNWAVQGMVLSLGVVIAAAGLMAPRGTSPTSMPSPVGAPPPVPTPPSVSASPSAPTAPTSASPPVPTAQVVAHIAQLAITLDEAGTKPTSTVPDGSLSIYAAWRVEGVSSRLEVHGRWIAVRVEGIDPNAVLSTSTQVVDQDTTASFSLRQPPDGWKPGSYRAEVVTAGEAPRVAEFVISGPAAASLPGVVARYFPDHSYNTPKKSGVSQTVALEWSSPPVVPIDGKRFWVEWEGLLSVPASGRYEFRLDGDGEGFLYLDGKRVIRETERSGSITLEMGRHTLRLGAIQARESGKFALAWKREGDQDYSPIDPQHLGHTQSQRQWKRTPRQAAQVGLEWLQSDSIAWQAKHQCFGCHVQGQVIMGLSVARANNYVVSEDYFNKLVEFTKQKQDADGKYHSGQHIAATQFAAMGLAFFDRLAKTKEDNGTLLKAVHWLLGEQAPTGEMPIDHNEPPIDQGSVMTTANSVVAFVHAFVVTGETRFRGAADRALAWITGIKAETTQDKAFKAMALARSGRPEHKNMADQVVEQLKAEQMGDGGSKETSAMPGSNAYATGQTLCAFKEAGVSVESVEFQRGVRFLLNRQKVTGAWPVESTQSRKHSEFAHTMWPVICLAGSSVEIAPEPTGRLQVVSDVRRAKKPTKNLEIILDLSGSMNFALGNTTRWQTALNVFGQVVAKLPDDFNVGLRVYAHRFQSRSPQSCTDTELIVPITTLDRNRLVSAVSRLRPRGDTPLVYSVLQAPADLKALGRGSVILITDGEETCRGDSAKAAEQLKNSGVDVTLYIVGFTIKGKQVEQQLTTFAEATGGRYYSAQSGEALARALLLAAVERFPYKVFDASGRLVAKGEAGSPADELPPGEYQVVVQAADQVLTKRVTVTADRDIVLKVVLKKDQFLLERQ